MPDARVQKHQKIRLQRLRMASTSYVVQVMIAAIAAALGAVNWTAVFVYMLAIGTVNVIFYAVFRSNLNLRFAQPNLTFLQVVAPLLPAEYLLYNIASPAARAGLLLTVLVPLLYGILDLSTRRFLVAAFLYFLGYAGVFLLSSWHHPGELNMRDEWIVLVTLAMLLIQVGFIGGFISQLRHSLRRKNFELKEAMTQISEMAVRDDLTGIYNRRRLIEVLKAEVARAARGDVRFSVCLFDIDHFKQINDDHGHLVGDRVLAHCARAFENTIRGIDTFGRFGGEEFLLIMPMTDGDAASIAANRLRAIIENLDFVDEESQPFFVTVSAGVAESTRESALETSAILRRADVALYNAKAAGRNCVRLDQESDRFAANR